MSAQESRRARLRRAMADVRFDAENWFERSNVRGGEALQRVVLAATPGHAAPSNIEGVPALKLLTQDPVYQLK